jgi:HAD superfamily hydrolase (TIGR01509 family)
MDGTLVDTERLWDVSLDEAARRLGRALSTPERESFVGSNITATVRGIHRILGASMDEAALQATARGIRARTAELFAGELCWCPGARETLASVRAAGLLCALVTSTERNLTELALQTLGRDHFEAVVCGDEVGGHTKPDPEPYARGARLLGVPAEECLAVEDSPPGAASARRAGARVLLVTPAADALPPRPGTWVRDSLGGVDMDALVTIYRSARAGRDHHTDEGAGLP